MPLDPPLATEQVSRIPLAQLAPSPFNPRSSSDTERLAELADSMRASGLQQPIVARPVIIENTQRFEIVFGHRRATAARSLGWDEIPAIVRDLSDEQVIVAQAIENLQREDLNALDEARGYRQLLDELQVPVDDIVARVGKSRTQIYARLKLLALVEPAQEALVAGRLGAEAAQLLARVPATLQPKALRRIEELNKVRGRAPSYREIRAMLLEDFTLELAEAPFPTDDAALLPEAGACARCPKRSGANLDLFGDVVPEPNEDDDWGQPYGPEICFDPDCFAAKRTAQRAREASALEAKGRTVVTGAAAKRALKADPFDSKRMQVKGDYIALADVKAELKSVKDKAQAPAVITLQDPVSGKTVEAVKRADLTAAGIKLKEKPNAQDDWRRQQEKRERDRKDREAKAEIEAKVRLAILEQLRAKVKAAPRSAFDLGLVAIAAYAGVEYQARRVLAKLWNHSGDVDKMHAKLRQLSAADLTLFLMDCALVNDVPVDAWRTEPAITLLAAAREYKVDAAGIRKEVEAACAQPPSEKPQPAKQPKKGRK